MYAALVSLRDMPREQRLRLAAVACVSTALWLVMGALFACPTKVPLLKVTMPDGAADSLVATANGLSEAAYSARVSGGDAAASSLDAIADALVGAVYVLHLNWRQACATDHDEADWACISTIAAASPETSLSTRAGVRALPEAVAHLGTAGLFLLGLPLVAVFAVLTECAAVAAAVTSRHDRRRLCQTLAAPGLVVALTLAATALAGVVGVASVAAQLGLEAVDIDVASSLAPPVVELGAGFALVVLPFALLAAAVVLSWLAWTHEARVSAAAVARKHARTLSTIPEAAEDEPKLEEVYV